MPRDNLQKLTDEIRETLIEHNGHYAFEIELPDGGEVGLAVYPDGISWIVVFTHLDGEQTRETVNPEEFIFNLYVILRRLVSPKPVAKAN